MQIRDLVEEDFPHIHTHEAVDKAIEILTETPYSSLPVFNAEGQFVGELSQERLLLEIVGYEEGGDGDFDFDMIRNALSENSKTIDPMVDKHQLTLQVDETVKQAASLMYEEDISTLPIFDDATFVGILSDIAILQHYKDI